MTLTEEQVRAWAALAEKATGDPWCVSHSASGNPRWEVMGSGFSGIAGLAGSLTKSDLDNNAAFIASARTAVPALAESWLSQREEIGRLRARVKEWEDAARKTVANILSLHLAGGAK